MTETPVCPRCGFQTQRISYGLPSFQMFESADRGEIRLGGCVIEPGAPDLACLNPHCELGFAASGR